MTNKTLTTTQARTQLFSLVDQVGNLGMSFTITKDGIPKAVIMCLDEYESWQETLDILSNKELMKDLRAGMKDFEEGRVLTEDEMRKSLDLE